MDIYDWSYIYNKLSEYGITECIKILNGTIKYIINVANMYQTQ